MCPSPSHVSFPFHYLSGNHRGLLYPFASKVNFPKYYSVVLSGLELCLIESSPLLPHLSSPMTETMKLQNNDLGQEDRE